MAETARGKDKRICNCFIDFQKAFDTIKHIDLIWNVLNSFGVDIKITRLLQNIYANSKAAVQVGRELGDWFGQSIGTRQGDPVSPAIFITYLERVMDACENCRTGVNISGELIDNLRFADDIDLLEERSEDLQESLNGVAAAAEPMGLRLNIAKTKVMVFGEEQMTERVAIGNTEIDCVKEFEYLGSLITWDNDCSREIKRRIAKDTGAMAGFNPIWRSKVIRKSVKLEVLRTCVFSVLLYASETWTMKKEDQRRLLAFEMKGYRRILNIRWQQKISNREVRNRVQATRNIVQRIVERKMNFFGHICRMADNRMVKKVVMGYMAGNNRRGRPRREWLDDIREWGGADLPTMIRATQDRSGWKRRVSQAVDTNG